ncbi:HNH endonuclease [Deinococcus ruber]|uniref:HNH nuclease domain-containing protein n=1 Tax=Deinococcus ruber TaxID=1848197 RepID=A0A918CE38_9DEIO|nr:HNH endonuclease [Deinococcus ruber]GGR16528.1 hypothetical protein GCM10008957_31470 [Deinococcus ruber]
MSISATKRLRILQRDEFACFYCGRTLHLNYPVDHQNFTHPDLMDYAALDHLDPQRSGGSHHDDNLVACCRACNSSKGGRTLEAYRFSLEMKNPIVQAREALKYARSLVQLPMDAELLAAVTLLEQQNTGIIFPGEQKAALRLQTNVGDVA